MRRYSGCGILAAVFQAAVFLAAVFLAAGTCEAKAWRQSNFPTRFGGPPPGARPRAARRAWGLETLERRQLLTSSAVVTFETTDSSGNVLTSVPVGTAFQLRAIVQDTSGRGANGGVFEAELDGTYNSGLVSIPSDAMHSVVTFGPEFINGQRESTQTPGLIYDTGGFSGLFAPGSGPQVLFTVPVTGTSAGTETFTPSLSTAPNSQIAVYGDNNPLPGSNVTYVPATITIAGTQPIIVVSGDGQSIADGSSAPSAAQGTDFGLRQVGGNPLIETYTIANNGGTPLSVGQVLLGGADAGDFSVTAQPAATVAAGSSTTFSVQFVAGAVGGGRPRSVSVRMTRARARRSPLPLAAQGRRRNWWSAVSARRSPTEIRRRVRPTAPISALLRPATIPWSSRST